MAYAATTLSRGLAIQQLATALRLTPAVTDQLLTTTKLFGAPKHALIVDYLDQKALIDPGK